VTRALPTAPPDPFEALLVRHGVDLAPRAPTTLQVNITKLCNQACRHCHVDASPRRTEAMAEATVDRVLEVLASSPDLATLDVTGGAPELHPAFERLVRAARGLGKHVMVRHNLTVQLDPHPRTGASLERLPALFAELGLEVVSSLPYHQEYFTDKQRGRGVFRKSVEALRRLNAVGYGEGRGLVLNLVHNPVGSFLPADQRALEARYREELLARHGVRFDALWTITNMPIHRFKEALERAGTYEEYMARLAASFNPAAAANVMCRSLVSVGYDGAFYDCDFNQMLELPILDPATGRPRTVFDDDLLDALSTRRVRTGAHCLGCTAGAGSSCGGATA
jgi:radical SAM/Cys-rich protein